MLQLTTKSSSRIFLVQIEGALDSQNSQDFKNYLQEKMKQGFRVFGLDMAQLQYISSRGIAILTELQNEVDRNHGGLALYHLSNEVKNLLDFLQISQRIRVFDQQKEAEYFLKEILMSDPQKVTEEDVKTEKNFPTEDELLKSAENAADELNERKLREEIEQKQLEEKERRQAEARKKMLEPKPLTAREVQKLSDLPTAKAPEPKRDEPPVKTSVPVEKPAEEDQGETEDLENDPGRYAVYDILETGLPVAQNLGSCEEDKDSTLVMCPNCESTLRVKKTGKHLCPACRNTFVFKV